MAPRQFGTLDGTLRTGHARLLAISYVAPATGLSGPLRPNSGPQVIIQGATHSGLRRALSAGQGRSRESAQTGQIPLSWTSPQVSG